MSRKIKAAFLAWAPVPALALRDATGQSRIRFDFELFPHAAGGVIEGPDLLTLRRTCGAILECLRASLGTDRLYVGLGGGIAGYRSSDRSRIEADRAVSLARRLGRPASVVSIEEVLLADAIAGSADVQASLAAVLEGLQAGRGRRPNHLLPSLEAFIDNHLSLARAAEALQIHPHTLAYRLRRIEQVLGLSLRSSDQRQVVEAAMLARRLGRGKTSS
jgi:sugar diacid utilization regulator